MVFSRQEYWSGLPCLLPGELPDPGTELMSLIKSPALADGFFTTSPTWVAHVKVTLKTCLSPMRKLVSLPCNHTEYFRNLATLLFSFVFLFPVLLLMCCSSPQARRVLGSVGLKVQGKAYGHREPSWEGKLAWLKKPWPLNKACLLLLLLLSRFSRVRLFATPWTAAYQAPLSMGFSRQEYWSGVPLPSPKACLCSSF